MTILSLSIGSDQLFFFFFFFFQKHRMGHSSPQSQGPEPGPTNRRLKASANCLTAGDLGVTALGFTILGRT